MPNRLRLTDSISLLLLQLQSRTSQGTSGVLATLRMLPRDAGVLAAVSQFGAMSQRRLSQLLEIDRSTMVTCVDRLQNLNLIVREAQPNDRRVTVVTLTSRGEQAVRDAKRELEGFESELLAPLTKAEQASFREILGKLRKPEPE